MNLTKLINMQGTLDNKIREEKGLQDKDLVANTFVALQVELAEFANEGRWFKHWKVNPKPRTKVEHICTVCEGDGYDRFEGFVDQGTPCVECNGKGKLGESNPLLEEFVDGLHFFLSIAIQNGWEDALYIYEEQLDPDEFNGNLTGYYMEMTYYLNKAYIEIASKEDNKKYFDLYGFTKNKFYFRMAWICFLNIGINGFGLTFDEIEKGYYEKNKINHARQTEGY